VAQHSVQRRRSAQHVVREVKERRIRVTFELHLLCRCANQTHLAQPLSANAIACPADHCGGLFDTDDTTSGANFCLEPTQAQSRATPDIEHGLARLQPKLRDGQVADGFERSEF
jgi:hypothetical protein